MGSVNAPVDVTAGPDRTVVVTCDENLLSDIETTVEGDTLIVRTVRNGAGTVSIDPTVDCRVTITTPGAERVTASGSGALTVTGETLGGLGSIRNSGSGGLEVRGTASNATVEVENSGSGDILVDAIDAGATDLRSTGSGTTTIGDGQTDALTLTITGSGDVDASGLVAGSADATVTGSGTGTITVTDAVRATITGSGDLIVHGNPDGRDTTETGTGSVRFE